MCDATFDHNAAANVVVQDQVLTILGTGNVKLSPKIRTNISTMHTFDSKTAAIFRTNRVYP